MILITFYIWVFMKILKGFLYLISVIALCIPLGIVICQGSENKTPLRTQGATVFNDTVCADGDLEKCLLARDQSLKQRDFSKAYAYLKILCEKFKDANSCYVTYPTFFAMQANVEKEQKLVRATLYEVLYYLDIGCNLGNMDSCMAAGKIYEYGVKPSSTTAVYGYAIAYDGLEAIRYFKKVCNSNAEYADDACAKVNVLTQERIKEKQNLKDNFARLNR